MKFLVKQEELLNAIQIVQRAISSKSNMPILNGIHLKVENNKLYLRATDLEIGIECNILVQAEEEGEILFPAKYFFEIIRKLPNINISISTQENSNLVKIKYGASEIELNSFDAEEYPALPEVNDLHTLYLNCDLFNDAIRQVSIAASNDTTRPVFTGILLEVTNGNMVRLTATDSHRLAYRQFHLKDKKSEEDLNLSIIIPSRSLSEINKIFKPEDNILEIKISENQILFRADSILLISRLIEGKFPNCEAVIPKNYTSRLRILKNSFQSSVERAALLSKDDIKTKSNIIKLNVNGNNLSITSKSAEIGSIYEEIPIHLTGENSEIGFNAKYLIDALKVINEEDIYFDLTGPLSPGIIKPIENDNYLFLVLPIRLL